MGWTALAFAGLTVSAGIAHAEETALPSADVVSSADAADTQALSPAVDTPARASAPSPAEPAPAEPAPAEPVAAEPTSAETAPAELQPSEVDAAPAPAPSPQAAPEPAAEEETPAPVEPVEETEGPAEPADEDSDEAPARTEEAPADAESVPALPGEESAVPAVTDPSAVSPIPGEDAAQDLEGATVMPGTETATAGTLEPSTEALGDEAAALTAATDLLEEAAAPSVLASSSLSLQTTSRIAPAAVKSGFKDVPRGMMYAEEILWMQRKGYATGWPDGTFRPVEDINRDAFVAMLYRIHAPKGYVAPTRSAFTDVRTNNMFYREISWAAQTGVTTGWRDGTFRPLAPIDRDAALAMMYRSYGGGAAAPPVPPSPTSPRAPSITRRWPGGSRTV